MKNKPCLGITGSSSFTDEVVQMVETYLKANFVLLYHNDTDNILEWLNKLDGVIIAGGVDIHPTVYNMPITNKNNFTKFNIDRDYRELTIIDNCVRNKIPMLGICRGHQIIGIYYGMEINPDLTDGSMVHAPHKQGITLSNNEPAHSVKLIGDKTTAAFNEPIPEERKPFIKGRHVYDPKCIWVNSYHHQGLKYSKKEDRKWDTDTIMVLGVAETGMKDCNGIIELMAARQLPWISCQWHPEIDYMVNTPSRKVLDRFNSFIGKNKCANET